MLNKKLIIILLTVILFVMQTSCSYTKKETHIVSFFGMNNELIKTVEVQNAELYMPYTPDNLKKYTFEGWYTDSDFKVKYEPQKVYYSFSLYSKWKGIYEGLDGYQYNTGVDETWYNTGTELPHGINYRSTELLYIIERGDIIYEKEGGLGITGHVALVEGIYYSEIYNQYYIRIIEAVSEGVVRSIITPQRFASKKDSVYRVINISKEQIDAAIDWAISQLGKPYSLALWKNNSINNSDWYCSELIWAAYYHQGIMLDYDDNDNLGSIVFPNEIIASGLLRKIE